MLWCFSWLFQHPCELFQQSSPRRSSLKHSTNIHRFYFRKMQKFSQRRHSAQYCGTAAMQGPPTEHDVERPKWPSQNREQHQMIFNNELRTLEESEWSAQCCTKQHAYTTLHARTTQPRANMLTHFRCALSNYWPRKYRALWSALFFWNRSNRNETNCSKVEKHASCRNPWSHYTQTLEIISGITHASAKLGIIVRIDTNDSCLHHYYCIYSTYNHQ